MSFFEEKKKREVKKKSVFFTVDINDVEKHFNLPQTQIEKKSSLQLLATSQRDSSKNQTISDKRKSKNLFVQSITLCLNKLPDSTDIHCYWDGHSFKGKPIGCPVRYYKRMGPNGEEDVYETVKIFCGVNCCNAHIYFCQKYNIDPDLYRESHTLLIQLYADIYGDYPPKGEIPCAPDKDLLSTNGGPMDIEKYRKSNENMRITSTNIRVRPFPTMISSSEIYQKECIF